MSWAYAGVRGRGCAGGKQSHLGTPCIKTLLRGTPCATELAAEHRMLKRCPYSHPGTMRGVCHPPTLPVQCATHPRLSVQCQSVQCHPPTLPEQCLCRAPPILPLQCAHRFGQTAHPSTCAAVPSPLCVPSGGQLEPSPSKAAPTLQARPCQF